MDFAKESDIKILTVVIPAYNELTLLDRMLKSLSDADNNNIATILIINDCDSLQKDDYLNIIDKYDLDIEYYRNENNIGVGATRELGWNISRTKWVSFLDQDDYVSKNYFTRFMDARNEYTEKMMYVFPKKIIHNTGKNIGIYYNNTLIHFGGNFYDRNLLKKYELRMSKNRMSDDIFFNYIIGTFLNPVYDFAKIYNDNDYIYVWDHTNIRSQTLSNDAVIIKKLVLKAHEEIKIFMKEYIILHPEVEEHMKKKYIDACGENDIEQNINFCMFICDEDIKKCNRDIFLLSLSEDKRKDIYNIFETRDKVKDRIKEKIKYMNYTEQDYYFLADIQLCLSMYNLDRNNSWKNYWHFIYGKSLEHGTIDNMQTYCDEIKKENAKNAILNGDLSYINDLI